MSMKSKVGLLVGAALMLCSVSAFADPTAKIEPGLAVPATQPQDNRFDPGFAASGALLFGLTPAIDLGASVGAMALPSKTPSTTEAGGVWGFGPTLRVKRPHDWTNNTSEGWEAVSPWADGTVQYVRTGGLDRAGMALAVGASVPTDDTRVLWVGPFLRFQDVFQDQTPGYDSRNSKTLILGLSFEFDPASQARPDPVVPQQPTRAVDHTTVVVSVDPPTETPTVVAAAPDFSWSVKKVQFEWDSSALDDTAKALLDAAAATLSSLPPTAVAVQLDGHASSEGQVEHNNVLSQSRADAVVDYLVSKGVARAMLTAKGFGSSVPVATNKTNAGRVLNRRVEFELTFTVSNGSK